MNQAILSAPPGSAAAELAVPLPATGRSHARVVLCVGALDLSSGAADFLAGYAAWVEGRIGETHEIWWAGDGVLRRVLAAQPLPPHLRQRFLGRLEPADVKASFAACDALVMPALAGDSAPAVADALAAGLRVIGSLRNRAIRDLVRTEAAGCLFDPLRPETLPLALDRVLGRGSKAPARPQAAERPR